MSWFFGKKKQQRDSPPSSPETENPPPGQGDEFIFVERRGNRPIPGPGINEGSDTPGENLYPNINNVPQYPAPAVKLLKQNSVEPIQNILNGLPFKLCKELVDNINDDVEIDRHRVNEILAYILRLENDDVVYDFSIEKSVINEMDSAESAM